MRFARAITGAIMGMAALAGCTVSGGGGGDPLSTENLLLQEAYVASLREPVPQISGLELGRMREGWLLSAFAQTGTLGWSAAQLRPRDPLIGPDGMLEFDFVAAPPQPEQPDAEAEAAQAPAPADPAPPRRPATLRADRALAPALVAQATGVRVWARDGAMEGRF